MFSKKPVRKRSFIITRPDTLDTLVENMMKVEEFAFDTETNMLEVISDLDFFTCVGISISWGPFHNYYIPLGHKRHEDAPHQMPLAYVVEKLKKPFERDDVTLVGSNIKFDLHVLNRIGIYPDTENLMDVQIFSWLCDENIEKGLKESTQRELGIPQGNYADVVKTVDVETKRAYGLNTRAKATYDYVLIKDGAPYALDDAFYTWELYKGYLARVHEEGMWAIYKRLYIPFLRALKKMESRGVVVDVDRLRLMQKAIEEDMAKLEYECMELAGVVINLGSSVDLAQLLFGKSGSKEKPEIMAKSFRFPIVSETRTGNPSTDKYTIHHISKATYKNSRKQEGVEFCKRLSEHRQLSTLLKTFVIGLEKNIYDNGKVHPSFNTVGTTSGRLSASAPNLQQLPRTNEEDKYQIRSLFIGSVDEVTGKRKKIIALDYSNLEMRVMAHMSGDKHLIHTFQSGSDAHGSTAVNMFNLDCEPEEVKNEHPHLRQASKTLNFLLIYGGGARTLKDNLEGDMFTPIDLGSPEYLQQYGCTNGIQVAQRFIDLYFESYSGVSKFMANQKKFARRYGFVYSILGRKRRLHDINSNDSERRSYNERLATNSTIQSSAADIVMSAQIRIDNDPWFEEHRALMLLQVHDELVFECPEEYAKECAERAKYHMIHALGEGVKLNVDLDVDYNIGDNYAEAK